MGSQQEYDGATVFTAEATLFPASRVVYDDDGTPFVVLGDDILDADDDAQSCKRFLLEILLRAAYDWACFGGKGGKRGKLWLDANTWLFDEGPGHPWWETREREGRVHLSFLAICDRFDKDPEITREAVTRFDLEAVISGGRPPLNRYPGCEVGDDHTYSEYLIMPLLLGNEARRITYRSPRTSEWGRGIFCALADECDDPIDTYVDRSREPEPVAHVHSDAMEEGERPVELPIIPKTCAWDKIGVAVWNHHRAHHSGYPAH